ncbi:winged helix-turn-helix transcriptional regulator [Burkholderia sp. MS455]|uniref:Transcriptional regulator n=3 Tax=Burkholderia cepacia complex TaxID=87882 RepID=A0A1X1PC82_9BURK|nr:MULTISPECIES: MarR family winged helix-turn-helix transcriptional regulator [Burkholderia]NTX28082.1 winged helix-turn-helix transcriptional regulator [Burkholderia pyrrocinia]ORT83315.1 transcriptional regulator [Burkholderia puraquae]QRR08650.1 winged helix-turn-helix transcriptional regulator [Burkholderia sp. MS455]QVN17419.1 winged helix-turn-helix transcriptional regulator [Burkholderia pyrrocinia]UXU87921.1 MarR family winged helix-turn-helix transcriptional regulator [Burkholderia s
MSEGVYGNQASGRVTHSLLRLSTAMRSQAWDWAEGAGLTPTQGEILVLLLQRKGPMRLGEIARETQLTAATTSDAVSTLETKGLVEKRRALDDGRALAVRLSARGRTAAKKALQWPEFLTKAVGKLGADEQGALYRALLKTLRELQVAGATPPQRMCVTCAHFQPGKLSKKTVHYCAALDISMSDSDLRLDCSVQEEADAATQKKTWKIFAG